MSENKTDRYTVTAAGKEPREYNGILQLGFKTKEKPDAWMNVTGNTPEDVKKWFNDNLIARGNIIDVTRNPVGEIIDVKFVEKTEMPKKQFVKQGVDYTHKEIDQIFDESFDTVLNKVNKRLEDKENSPAIIERLDFSTMINTLVMQKCKSTKGVG